MSLGAREDRAVETDQRFQRDVSHLLGANVDHPNDHALILPAAGHSCHRGVPAGLPALARAVKLQEKASAVGFDWADAVAVLVKVKEEILEIEEAVAGGEAAAVREEVGDLLFAVANLARRLDVDPEGALRQASVKFERRFGFIEEQLRRRGRIKSDLQEMEALWLEAKRRERDPGGEPT